MGLKFVISHLDEQLGPFDEAELKAKWVKGEILPIDYVYDDVKQDWILLSDKFAWAKPQTDVTAPPPLSEITVRKARATDFEAKPSPQGTKVKLVDGVGEIDLASLKPGDIELVLQDSSGGTLKLQNPLRIHVKASEPYALEWSLATQQTVGQELEVQIRAIDRSGQICHSFDEQFSIRVNGSEGKEFPAPIKNGQALIKIPNTKAETWRLSFHYKGPRVLQLPEDRTLEWQPGPATKLVLDGPQNYVAGQPLKIQVKAVDNWGNVAKTFQGSVVLEVKAS